MATWKKGRGKLGIMAPLIGKWVAEADSPRGKFSCSRQFELVLGNQYVRLDALWKFADTAYTEQALYGIDGDAIRFWSFTSDGKNSTGKLADGSDVHPDAICFEAEMPAGTARMIYWPDGGNGFFWAVESKTKKGWNRFAEHHYEPA
jgi:hypothetical protein